MINRLAAGVCVVCLITLNLQAQTVLSFMGGSFQNSSVSVSFTGGEPVSGTFQNSTLVLAGGFSGISEVINVSNEATDSEVPTAFGLSQNYPNPFNPTTNIQFDLPEQATIRLEVFNSIGSSVALLENGVKTAGRYTITFNASRLSSGMYFYRLIADGQVIATQKMLLIK